MSVNLFMGCPCCANSHPTYWQHTSCTKPTTITTSQGKISCRGCTSACKERHFRDCKWKCRKHEGSKYADDDYYLASLSKVILMIGKGIRKGQKVGGMSESQLLLLEDALEALGESC